MLIAVMSLADPEASRALRCGHRMTEQAHGHTSPVAASSTNPPLGLRWQQGQGSTVAEHPRSKAATTPGAGPAANLASREFLPGHRLPHVDDRSRLDKMAGGRQHL